MIDRGTRTDTALQSGANTARFLCNPSYRHNHRSCEASMMIFPVPIITPFIGAVGGASVCRARDPFDFLLLGFFAIICGALLTALTVMALGAAEWLPLVPPRQDKNNLDLSYLRFPDTLALVMKWYARFAIVAAIGVVASAAVWKLRRVIAGRSR